MSHVTPERLAARRLIEDHWREANGYGPSVELTNTEAEWAFLEGLVFAAPPPVTYGHLIEAEAR